MALLLCLTACSSTPRWEGWQRSRPVPAQRYGEIAYCSHDPASGLELRFRKAVYGLHGYISVRSGHIPTMEENPRRAHYWFTVEGEEPYYATGILLEGGQRILVEEEDAQEMLALLEAGTSFLLELENHSDHISDEGFQCGSRRMRLL